MSFRNLAVVAAFAIFLVDAACGERPPESRDDATHVVVGQVAGVYSYQDESNTHYVIKLEVQKVERGAGVAEQDLFYAECFQRKKSAPRIPAAYGHKAVPKPGQRIRAYVIRGPLRNEGIYPDWFEVLPMQ